MLQDPGAVVGEAVSVSPHLGAHSATWALTIFFGGRCCRVAEKRSAVFDGRWDDGSWRIAPCKRGGDEVFVQPRGADKGPSLKQHGTARVPPNCNDDEAAAAPAAAPVQAPGQASAAGQNQSIKMPYRNKWPYPSRAIENAQQGQRAQPRVKVIGDGNDARRYLIEFFSPHYP
jgi:hypothetical protein